MNSTRLGNTPNRNFGGSCRREFLRIGGLGLGSLALPQLMAARASAAHSREYVRDKAVVLLFLAGGPPQHETFDSKMTAPSEIRSTTGEVPTSLPGVTFGSDFVRNYVFLRGFGMFKRTSNPQRAGSNSAGRTFALCRMMMRVVA